MRKSPRFLPVLVSLSMLFLASPIWAAGYTCPESKRYTSCNANYYMTASGVGNDCKYCPDERNTTDTQACSTSQAISHGTRVSSGTQPCTGKYTSGTGSDGTAAQIGIGTCQGCDQWGTCTYNAYTCNCDTNYHAVNQGSASCTCEANCTNTCTSTTNTTSTQACTPTNTVSNAKTTTCLPGTQTCNGNYTGGTNCGGGSCSGCSSWGACSTSCKAATCNANHYLNDGACLACDTGFTAPDGNTGGASTCSKSCTKTCAGNNTAQCPANATCTYDTASTTSGTQNQGGACSAKDSLCPMKTFTCNTGYTKNSAGTACVLASTTCEAGQYLPAGKTSCEPCTAGNWCKGGTFNYNTTTNQGLTACPTGYVDGGTGLSAENQCKIKLTGKYIATPGDATGTPCTGGLFKTEHTVAYGEKSFCDPCPRDTYSEESGPNASCTPCLPGYTTGFGLGESSCKITCAGGTYLKTNNATVCTAALDGEYAIGRTYSQGEDVESQPFVYVCGTESSYTNHATALSHAPGSDGYTVVWGDILDRLVSVHSDGDRASREDCYAFCPETPGGVGNGTYTKDTETAHYHYVGGFNCYYTLTCNFGYEDDGSHQACPAIRTPCEPGTYLPAGTLACEVCPAGSYCWGNTDLGYQFNPNEDKGIWGCEHLNMKYCPEGSAEGISCPLWEGSRPGYKQSDIEGVREPIGNYTDCWHVCPLKAEDIEHAESLTAVTDRVYAISADEYAPCEYNLSCEIGYIPSVDPETGAPICRVGGRTLYLDDQGADTPAGIESAYLLTGSGWYPDDKLESTIRGIGTLPTKMGYVFAGYYTQKNGQGAQIVDENGNFMVQVVPGTGALLYAKWAPGTWTCTAGTYYANGVGCLTCNPNHYCLGGDFITEGGDQGQNPCADLGDGFWNQSAAGGAAPNSCYQTCVAHSVTYGTATPVEPQAFYPAMCDFTGTSITGNPCNIVDGVCVETSCLTGFEMVGGICTACARENAISYTGNCQITGCIQGYHPNAGGLACVDDVRECLPPNAEYATQTWNPRIQAFGGCIIHECVDGYHVSESANACVLDEQTCTVEHGVGIKEWDSITNTWGKCVATTCDPGYTNDPSETNDTAAACGRCRNYYSILGTPAASSYIRECEIASCMYQGELYILRDNECEPICDINGREDDTGYMKWNPKTGKCDRSCKTGYSMW